LSRSLSSETNLQDADLRKAYLYGAMFIDAIVRGANFSHAHMGSTTLTGLDLRVVKGLDTIPHSGPSSIGIDTVYRSGGNIPEVFLREAGVPEPFIVHMKSLVAAMSPIEFYSC